MVNVSVVLPAPPVEPARSKAVSERPFADTEPVLVADLLHPRPLRRIDFENTKLAIALAFASGVSGGALTEALDNAKVAPSTWEAASFVADLFVPQFVARCMSVRIDGQQLVVQSAKHLAKVLSHPPADPAVVHHRRAILRELAGSPKLRHELERLYLTLCTFRSVLEGATGTGKWDINRRQLDILTLTKEIIDRAADNFTEAKSGLSRLGAFGRRVREGEPYRSLADLLRYDERLATLNLKIRVGADGRIRGFEVLGIQEDDQNPFVSSPWRRWLSKLELFVRGFKFSDGEVMARLIDAVFEGIQDEIVPLVQLLGDLELYLGALGFQDAARDAGLAVCLPELVSADEPRDLRGLFNPLLLAHGITPVPCDLLTDRHDTTVLVTGPNSGGKTRLLQSLGLTQLLAQSGLFVPARSGSLALATGLVVSLIEETKADQSEGRLGTELMRIRALFERLPPGAMVILDELCSGTNPSEGEEIFELVVAMLSKLGPQAFITTHFLAFAARLERQRNIEALRFLQVELGAGDRPTYQFVPGVAQTSLASHAAARLGVTREQLLSLIERNSRSTHLGAAPMSSLQPRVRGDD
jgi:DNA mismatch repair protein MutS2